MKTKGTFALAGCHRVDVGCAAEISRDFLLPSSESKSVGENIRILSHGTHFEPEENCCIGLSCNLRYIELKCNVIFFKKIQRCNMCVRVYERRGSDITML